MNDNIKYLLELLETQRNGDIRKSIEHFDLITNSLFILTQSLYDGKEKVKYYQRELEGKFFRYGLANQSIINLIKGNQFKLININVLYGDIFSIKSIVRMQIESFIIMFYLFFDKITDEEKDVRYSVYKLHGLRKQSSFPVKTSFAKTQFEKINKEIQESEEIIINSSIFEQSTKKEKESLLFPKFPKMVKSNTIIEKSGLKNSRILDMWQIYSNYAHAEHISDRQYNTLYKIEKSITKDCLSILELNSILTSNLILFLKDSFVSCTNKYNELSEKEKVHIETWGKLFE
jgi:hypothetical protein